NGRIDPAALTVTGNSATGTYTGQAQSVSGFTVNGLQGTDTVASLSTVSASGAMRTNAGTALNTVTAGLENNYTVTTTNGTLSITPAQLSAMLVGEVGKVYDGNLGATLAQENYVLSGWMAGEGAAVTQTTGLYADKHAGSGKQVSVNLGAGDFNAQTGTLLSNYVLPTAAEGQVGQVTPALILVGGLTAANKVYDGNTAATLDSSQAVLSGKVAGDNVALLSANGSFSDKNVGVGKTVTVTDLSLGGADAGNYRLASNTASTTADITRLGEVRWIGGPTGNWFDPANWEGGAVPDRANVAKVILPQGVTAEFDLTGYDASSAPVDLEELGKAGSLRLMNGALNIGAGGMQLDTFDQSGGVLAVNGPTQVNTLKQSGGEAQLNGGLTVLRDFEQSGAGRLRVVGDANITDTQGGVTLGALEVQGGLRLQSLDGDIRQLANTALKIGGATDLKASRGNPAVPANIDLANEGNDFIGTVSADGANISLRDSNALTLGQVDAKAGLTLRSGGTLTLGSTTVGGQLTAISDGGGIRQTGRLLVGGDTVLDAGLGDIVLENPDNVFDGRLTSRGSGLSSVKGRGVEDTSAVGGTVRQTTVGSPTANAASPSTSGPVLNEGGAPGAAPVNNGVIVEGPVRLSADVGTSTPTSPASPATTAAATGDGGSAPSSVNVMQVRAASPQTVGLVTVEVPTAQLASGFTALLPPAIANSLRTAAQVEASLPDGQPLPAWLQFDSQAMAFRSQQVPPDALPLLIALRSGAASVIVKVDQMSVQ
ncbi:MAG: YDG domain-containing protein, partial [Ideonella sp.]|nr:YDG domain-containing protein [Ideonella sp.]